MYEPFCGMKMGTKRPLHFRQSGINKLVELRVGSVCGGA